MPSEFCLIYTSTDSKDNADELSKELINTGLIACANIYSNVNSIYRWQGNIENADEFVIILKTRTEHFPTIEKIIQEKHSYTCPAILQIPIMNINANYKDWLDSNIEKSPKQAD